MIRSTVALMMMDSRSLASTPGGLFSTAGTFSLERIGVEVLAVLVVIVLLLALSLLRTRRRQRIQAEQVLRELADAASMPAGVEQPVPAAVPATSEWLLEDNTLVRTGAVRPQYLQSQQTDAIGSSASSIAIGLADTSNPRGRVPQRPRTRPLRIAMMGSRGIPASYSGFETAVEQLSVRLVERGHTVTVYCRSHHITWPEKTYKGVRLIKLPTIRSKHFDTIAHTLLSMLHGLLRRYDVIYICGVGNAPVAFVPQITGKPTIVNVDGADWQRDKWGRFAKWYLRMAERAATRMPTCIVSDSRVVERYYMDNFRKPSIFIPYGSDVPRQPAGETLARLGLEPDGYILWVGRLVPENNAHHVVEAYQRLGGPATGLKLCIVGDAPYASDYITDLKANAGPGVVFAGYVFGSGYHELGSNARVFAFASGVGGTHPALLEAMAFGNCVIVNDMAANMETVGDAAIPYRGTGGADALAPILQQVLARPELIAEYRRRARERAENVYSWDAVTTQYEALFAHLARRQH